MALAELEAMFERARLDTGLSFDAALLEPSSDDHANVPPNVPRNQNPETAPQPQVTLGEAYERYLNDPTHRWSERTRDTYDTTRALVVSVMGADHPLRSISRADVRSLIEVLRFLPRNANKRFPKLTPKEAAERVRQSGEGGTISAANANVYLSNLSSFLNWAVNEEIAERNPARGLRLPDEVAKRDKRNPFSAEQLRLIFNAPLYRGCQDGDRGYANPGTERPQNARYWVPLIALHTGLRLNEICQLDVTDVCLIEGIPCILVTTQSRIGTTDKKLKTGASERLMPLHPRLIDLGLMDYAARQKRLGQKKLFAEIDPGSKGVRAVAFSKWFTQFLGSLGARRERTCFHSFRHCFRDELRNARIGHDLAMALGGWVNVASTQSKVSENYGSGHRVEVLADAMSRLTFRDIDLSHIKR